MRTHKRHACLRCYVPGLVSQLALAALLEHLWSMPCKALATPVRSSRVARHKTRPAAQSAGGRSGCGEVGCGPSLCCIPCATISGLLGHYFLLCETILDACCSSLDCLLKTFCSLLFYQKQSAISDWHDVCDSTHQSDQGSACAEAAPILEEVYRPYHGLLLARRDMALTKQLRTLSQ